ncbi:restriction endonuclease subunit S [Salinibius halmophilus]|uniref:restriction endonuclease subunit S n=1 Tax=Salinibius halmophilus TaxID=1853216 RepID=UPI000E66676F|nr:restriction endonuclease subunit S [Salinibius halmophilus]
MGRYAAYPKYKESRIDWLDVIPSHWKTSKLRYLFTFGKGLTITKENLVEEGVPVINYGEVHSKYGFEVNPTVHELKCVPFEYRDHSQFAFLSKGDVVFADTSEDLEGSGNFSQASTDEELCAGYHTIIARPYCRQAWRYYAYLLDSLEIRTQVQHAVKGVKVFSVTQAILRGISTWLPPIDEREQIANFLDHETAKIDALIEKQQRLIELLKEKRQAIISHAVTKGLDPNAPMKDSGVEWLGQVPAHWEVVQLRRISSLAQGLQIPQSMRRTELADDCVEYITVKSINSPSNEKEYIYKPSARVCCKPEDILLARTGATGQVVTGVQGAFHNNFFKVEYSDQVEYEFLLSLLGVKELTDHLLMLAGTTTIPDLNHGAFLSTKVALPPKPEQLDLVNRLRETEVLYSNMLSTSFKQIELLKERRTALISAAVTGKIDVRDWQPSKH